MAARRVLLSHKLINQMAFDRELIALNKASNERMAKEAEGIRVGCHLPQIPHVERRYVPIRERSLQAVITGRSLRSRRSAGRQAGFNKGRNVTFRD